MVPWCSHYHHCTSSFNSERRSCAGSNPARGVPVIPNDRNLWQWPQLEIRLNVFVGQPYHKNNSSSSSSLSSSSSSSLIIKAKTRLPLPLNRHVITNWSNGQSPNLLMLLSLCYDHNCKKYRLYLTFKFD